jgi:hypothetical protein
MSGIELIAAERERQVSVEGKIRDLVKSGALNAAYLDTIRSLEATRDELRKVLDEAVARVGDLEEERAKKEEAL